MRIVSLNAWGGALFGELGRWVTTVEADVLCLQEATRTAGHGGWTRFSDSERELPQRADLVGDIAALLPTHRILFDASDSGPVTVSDGQRARQEFGLATFLGDDLDLLTRDACFVHGEHRDHLEWPSEDRPRVAQAIRVAARGGPVTVVHVHGLRSAAGKQDSPPRRAQAERIAELVIATRQDGDVVVVCGDLNVLPDSDTFDVLAAVGLTDLVGDADTRTSRYAKSVRHASYLLVSDTAAVDHFEILRAPEVSDHRALVLDLF